MEYDARRFIPSRGKDHLPHTVAEIPPLELFELYPSIDMRIAALENAASLWHYTPQEDRHRLHTWAQEHIHVMLFLDDPLWKNIVLWYLRHTKSDEDSVVAINLVLSLNITMYDNMLSCPSQAISKELGSKFQRWLRSEVQSPHRIPYAQIPGFEEYVVREFEGFAKSIDSEDELQLRLGDKYYGWEQAEIALRVMLTYATTERELLPTFHELVASTAIKFKEHVIPGSSLDYNPLTEGARLGMLEYVELTLRQAIEHSE